MSKRIADFKDLKNLLGRKDHHNPNDFGIDGEDHINIANISKTPVGRFLTITSKGSFDYPLIGTFDSVHALEYWLKAEGQVDEIRHTSSADINKHLKSLNKIRIPNFKMITLLANYTRLMKRPDLIRQIKALPKDAPVLSYFVHRVSGLRMVTSYAESYIPLVNELIRAIQNDRVPNYRGYLDRRYPNATLENGFLDDTAAFINIVKPNMELKEERSTKKRLTGKKRTQVKEKSIKNATGTLFGIDEAGDKVLDKDTLVVHDLSGEVIDLGLSEDDSVPEGEFVGRGFNMSTDLLFVDEIDPETRAELIEGSESSDVKVDEVDSEVNDVPVESEEVK